jgi:hypothetical protein
MKRGFRRCSNTRLAMESLEPRLPLAGNIVANLVGDTLYLSGDRLDNDAIIHFHDGQIGIQGLENTTINGALSFSLDLEAPSLNLVLNGNSGNDDLLIYFYTSTTAYDVVMRGGDGHDHLQARSTYGGILYGNIVLDGGRGDDALEIHGEIAGNANILGGAGEDVVLCLSQIHGDLLISTGDQNDRVIIPTGSVGGQFTLDGGKGRDTITLAPYLAVDAIFYSFEDIRLG